MEGTLPSSTSSGSLLSNKRSERRRPPPPKAAPWLVFQHGEGMKCQALYNPCEPNNKISTKYIPELSGREKIYWQKPCHQGWIVILDKEKDDPTCFLWNPLSPVSIKLPKLFQGFMDYEIYDCVLTLPLSNKLREFMVFFLISNETTSENLLVFSHPGAKQWRIKCLDENYEGSLEIYSLHYLKGKLYVICSSSDWHLEIEPNQQQLAGGGHDKDDQTLSVRQFRVERYPFIPHAAGITTWFVLVYVESFDHIFQVRIFYGKRGIDEPRAPASTVQILRLDLSLMAWVDVRSLGDDVLFIGTDSTSSYCSAADMGLQRGCLFYTLPEDKSLYIYEVEDDGITIVLPFPNLPTPWLPGNWMMIPTDNIRNGRRITENLSSRDDKEAEGYKIIVEKLKETCIDDDEAADGQNKNNSIREMEVEVETPPRWDILDNDIVELIAGYLNPKDYSRFRSVCKRNLSMFPQVYPPRPNVSPALLVFNSFKDDGTIFNFVDPMHNEKYSMKKDLSSEHLLLEGATIRFSKYGWLLLISKDMKTPFFYDPLTKVIIRLPNFPDVGHMLHLSGMSFSSSPTSPDCAVFAIQPMNHNAISIYAIKRGSCAYWRYLVLENLDDSFVPCFNNPVFFRMEFFCLDYSGTLGRCVVNDNGDNNGLHWGVLRKPSKQFNDAFPSYLVECDGNLLLVNVGHVGETVGVFSLDWTNKVWTKIESLGRHMLFISSTSSFSAIAPPNSQMKNKVYFPRLHKDGRGLLFYSLDTGTYHYSISRIQAQQKSIAAPASATNFYDTKEMCNCTWIEPDWSQGNTPIDDPDHLWLA